MTQKNVGKHFPLLTLLLFICALISLGAKWIDPQESFKQGTVYLGQGNLQCAIDAFTRAIEKNPSFVEAFNNRGLAYFEQKDLERAREDFLHALELDPENAITNNNLGVFYFNTGEYQKALYYFKRALKYNQLQGPYMASVFRNLSRVYKKLGDMTQSQKAETQAVQIEDRYPNQKKRDKVNPDTRLWSARRFGISPNNCGLVLKIYKQD